MTMSDIARHFPGDYSPKGALHLGGQILYTRRIGGRREKMACIQDRDDNWLLWQPCSHRPTSQHPMKSRYQHTHQVNSLPFSVITMLAFIAGPEMEQYLAEWVKKARRHSPPSFHFLTGENGRSKTWTNPYL